MVKGGRLNELWKANSSFVLAAGSGMIAPAVGLLTAPILTRLYSPAEFGVLGSFAAILASTLALANLRYEVTVPLPKEEGEAYSLARAAMKIGLVASVVISAVVLGIAPLIFKEDVVSSLWRYAWWLPLALALASVTQVLTQYAIRRGAFGELAGARLAQGLTGPGVQIAAGAAGMGVLGLLIGQAASQCGGLFRLFRSFKVVGGTLPVIPPAGPLLKRYQKFPRVALFPAFMNAIGLQLPIFVVSYTHGTAAAGLVLLINRVFGTPVSILGAAGGQTLVSEAAKLHREGLSALPVVQRTFKRQLLLLGPFLLIVPALPWLFPRIFGREWAEAGRLALAYAPALIAIGIFGPLFAMFDIHERQDIQLKRECIRLVSIIGAVWVTKEVFGGSIMAIMLALSVVLIANLALGYLWVLRVAGQPRHS